MCTHPYEGAKFCGPMYISWGYWDEAGQPHIHSWENATDERILQNEAESDEGKC